MNEFNIGDLVALKAHREFEAVVIESNFERVNVLHTKTAKVVEDLPNSVLELVTPVQYIDNPPEPSIRMM
jgi:hypothetical protein